MSPLMMTDFWIDRHSSKQLICTGCFLRRQVRARKLRMTLSPIKAPARRYASSRETDSPNSFLRAARTKRIRRQKSTV